MISPAKRAALAALHESRRGVPVNPEPPPELDQLRHLIAQANSLVRRSDNPYTLRKLGKLLGIHDKSLRRWLSGVQRPSIGHHAAIRRVVRDGKQWVKNTLKDAHLDAREKQQ